MDNNNPTAVEKRLTALKRGLTDEFPASSQSVNWCGKQKTLAEVHASVDRALQSVMGVREAYARYVDALQARKAAAGDTNRLHEDAVLFLRCHYGRNSPKLARFGIATPKKRRLLTVEQQGVAVAKAKATRAQRDSGVKAP